MRDYRKIGAWKKADDLVIGVYEMTAGFPKSEVYGLTSQVRRSAYSVPANIAEGSARNTKRDYLHFLYISRGSLTETQYFLNLSCRLKYLSIEEHKALESQIKQAFAALHGLIQAVEKESGRVTKAASRATSYLVLLMPALGRFSFQA